VAGRAVTPRCALPGQVKAMLSPPGGPVRAELEPVTAALTRGEPELALKWLEGQAARKLLPVLAAGKGSVTHDALDKLGPARSTAYLRAALVAAGVLPWRDEHLAAFERWLPGALAKVSDDQDRRVIRSYATWGPLRRPRRQSSRRPLSRGQQVTARSDVQAAIRLTGWLRERESQPGRLSAGRHRRVAHLGGARPVPGPQLPRLVHGARPRRRRRDPREHEGSRPGRDLPRRGPPVEHRQGPAARPRARDGRPRRRLPGAPLRAAAHPDRRPHARPRRRDARRPEPCPGKGPCRAPRAAGRADPRAHRPATRSHRHRARRGQHLAGRSARSNSAPASAGSASLSVPGGRQRSSTSPPSFPPPC
jgi:hypothetical protein